MQYYGWLETLIYNKFPDKELVVRDLGFGGDEVGVFFRTEGFGSQDEWLTRCQANVILAFYGYNESYAGKAGLKSFTDKLDKFVKQALEKKYDGKSQPRIVLFSSIAQENLHDPNLPDGVDTTRTSSCMPMRPRRSPKKTMWRTSICSRLQKSWNPAIQST